MEKSNEELLKELEELRKANSALQDEIIKRDQLKEILRESENQFRLLVEGIPGIVYSFSENRGGMYYSSDVKNILGYSLEELNAKPMLWHDSIHPDDLPKVNQVIQEMKQGKTFHIEYQIQDINHNWHWFEDRSIGIKNKGENPIIVGHALDITDRKNAEKLLKESQENYQFLIENISDVIWILNLSLGKFTFISPSVLQLRGFTETEAMSQSIHESLTPESAQKVMTDIPFRIQEFQNGIRKTYLDHLQQPCKDKSIKWIETVTNYQYAKDGTIEVHGVSRDITDRKLSERALKESEEKFRVTFEHAPIGVINRSLDGHFLSVNQSFCDIMGYSKEEILSMTFMELTHPDFLESSKDLIKRLLGGETINGVLEKKYIRKDGRVIWGSLSTSLLRKEDGSPDYFINTVQDITEQKQVEFELIESEARFKTMFEKHNAIMILLEPKTGLIIDANHAASKFYGYSKSKLCSMNMNEINALPPEQVALERLNALAEKKNFFIFPHKLANGKERIVEVHASPIQYQNKIILFSIIHDITDRKEAEEQLIQLAVEKKTILDNIGSGIFFLKNRKVIWANNKAAAMYEYPLEDIIGDSTLKFHLNKNAYENFGAEAYTVLASGLRFTTEVKQKKRSGEEFWCSFVGQAINPNDLSEGSIWISEDISQRKEMEEKIQRQNKELIEANVSKDKFFSIIAHDLKGPFVGFLGLTEMMQSTNFSSEEIKNIGIQMNKSAENLFKLLENLLTWARMQRGAIDFRQEKCALSIIVKHNVVFLSEYAKQKNIELISRIPNHVEVFVDLEMINTVFRNLISNAIKFTKRGGKVIIAAEDKGKEILIYIQDSGIGMSEKILEGIFRIDIKSARPGTEKESSTGLGLLLCKDFIEKHNGKIWAESEVDKGSTFYFTLGR